MRTISFQKLLVVAFCAFGPASVAAHADVTAGWELHADFDDRSIPGASATCTFTQVGERLSGRCEDATLIGEVKGETVTWRLRPAGTDDTMIFTGMLDDDDTVIVGRFSYAGRGNGSFLAARRNPSASARTPRLNGQGTAGSSRTPAFEVASIKANTSGSPRSGTHNQPGGRVTITNQRLRDIVRTAFGSTDLEVAGGPDWIDADRWDIVAVAGPGAPADAPWQSMLKSLLADRFRLQAHVEQREHSIYQLVFARDDQRLGPDIHETRCAENADCGGTTANTNGIKSGTITGSGRHLTDLAVSLSPYAERRVFDATHLAGRYDFQLRWSEDVSIFTALQEQLGLKLVSTRGPVDVVVIDHVEKPTPD